jgi:hypothetical protein
MIKIRLVSILQISPDKTNITAKNRSGFSISTQRKSENNFLDYNYCLFLKTEKILWQKLDQFFSYLISN